MHLCLTCCLQHLFDHTLDQVSSCVAYILDSFIPLHDQSFKIHTPRWEVFLLMRQADVTGRDRNNGDNLIQIFILGGNRGKRNRWSPDDSATPLRAVPHRKQHATTILSFPHLSNTLEYLSCWHSEAFLADVYF